MIERLSQTIEGLAASEVKDLKICIINEQLAGGYPRASFLQPRRNRDESHDVIASVLKRGWRTMGDERRRNY